MKMIIPNIILPNSQIQFRSCFGDPLGVGKLAVCDRNINAEKYVEILQDNLFQGTKSMLGKTGEVFIFQHDNAPLHKVIFTKILPAYP